MGTYIEQSDLEDELGTAKLIQLTNEGRSADTVNTGRVNKAIAYAESTVEGYLRTRYQLPVPRTVKVVSLCTDLAIYHLQRDRCTTKESADKLKMERYDPTIKFLEAVQGGKAALDVPAATETAKNPANPDRVMKGNSNQTFSKEKLSSF